MQISKSRIKITTHQYEFELQLIEYKIKSHFFNFRVNNNGITEIEGHIIVEDLTNSENKSTSIAKLNNIKVLQESSLYDIINGKITIKCYERELIDAVFFYIHCRFPKVQTISIYDTSYIPCIRESSDTIDLLIYSIALYEKTWYENAFNAYIKPLDKYNAYRYQVEQYASIQTKSQTPWMMMYILMTHGNIYTSTMVEDNKEQYEKLYIETTTFPQFLRAINDSIPNQFRCRFFKDWLEDFIRKYIHVERDWYFDLYPRFDIIE